MQSPRKSKRLGQHFLCSDSWLERIADELAIEKDQHIVEIGSGDGALTALLAQTGAKITALEFDARRIPLLIDNLGKFSNLRIVQGNALEIDTDRLLGWEADVISLQDTEEPDRSAVVRMVGNLPYNIASQVMLRFAPLPRLADLTFTIQHELAARLVAMPKSSDYGRFTLSVSLWRDAEILCNIPPDAFDPPPKVLSSLIRLGNWRAPQADSRRLEAFQLVVRTAFSQRRKQLGNCLRSLLSKERIAQLGIDPQQRAEELSKEQFLLLADATLSLQQQE